MEYRLARIHDRETFLERAESEVRRAQRYGRTLTILMLEVDDRRSIATTHGEAWLEVLTAILALVCRETLRAPDILGRYGDECLAFVLPEANEAAGVQLAARLIRGLRGISLPTATGPLTFTVSAGVAASVGQVAKLADIVVNCERQLHAARAAGGNQVKGCFVGDRRDRLDEALARLGRRRTDPKDAGESAVELTREELELLLERKLE